MVNKKIIIIRKKLDKLDDAMLGIIKVRSNLVNQILRNKQYKNQIIDKKRIELILKRIKKKSLAKGIDTKVHKKFHLNDKSFIDYEFRNFGKK